MPELFEYLPLILKTEGLARFSPPPYQEEITRENKANRSKHAKNLSDNIKRISEQWIRHAAEREKAGLPSIAGIPLLLKIDPTLDLDNISKFLGFEVISEEDDGFVIVSTNDISFDYFEAILSDFIGEIKGSATVAEIHEILNDLDQQERLRRILSDKLFQEFPTLSGDSSYICDFSISCVGTWTIPPKPKRGRLTDEKWAEKITHWDTTREERYKKWESLKDERYDAVGSFVSSYNGEILSDIEGMAGPNSLPDSFSLRLKLPASGLKDFVLNYPYIFEVVEPDDIELPQENERQISEIESSLVIEPPAESAPRICIIDSGIQEGHLFLEPAIDRSSSHCFLPSEENDISDLVENGGHGTRVARAVLYGEDIPTSGNIKLKSWIQNARVLNAQCALPKTLYPPALLKAIVSKYTTALSNTRIFNHSINASTASRIKHMSAWAAEIDKLSYEKDILFIQSAGNLCREKIVKKSISDNIPYPHYLNLPKCRISNPAQSFQAITVGSVAKCSFEEDGWKSFASNEGEPSAFTRCGIGIWGSIKPEVVEYGGDYLHTDNHPIDVAIPSLGKDCYPNTIRSTLTGGPAICQDNVGTSYSTPKVTKIASTLEALLPNESALLYRALIIQSARWPFWSQSLNSEQRTELLCRIGYGIADEERASTNSDYRTTFITTGERIIQQGDCHVYQVPIPRAINRPGADYEILVEVTLSYAAEPRRTRKSHRGYLSTWLDWISNRRAESLDAFLTRALKGHGDHRNQGQSFGWTIESKANDGQIADIRRNIGTVQKDWATVKSNSLPDNFCIAVRAHRGWNKDPEAAAPYSLVVTLEILGKEVAIYEPLKTAVNELELEMQNQDIEVSVKVNGE